MKRIFAGLALACATSFAFGADNTWYLGASLGQAEFDSCPGATCAGHDQAYKVFAGYRWTRNLALEAGYVDFGKVTVTTGDSLEIKPRGFAGHLVASWPLTERFSVLGRIGMVYGDAKVSGATGSRSDKGAKAAYGIGAQFDVARDFMVRLEWERYRFKALGDSLDVDAATLGVMTTF